MRYDSSSAYSSVKVYQLEPKKKNSWSVSKILMLRLPKSVQLVKFHLVLLAPAIRDSSAFRFCGRPIFGSVFRLSYFKTAVFRFWCLAWFFGVLRVLSNLIFVFSVFVNNDGCFSDFYVQCILRLFWFCQGSYTQLSR